MNEEENSTNLEKQTTTTNNTDTGVVNERKGFNITALVSGIVATCLFCYWPASLVGGIMSIIFSIAGRKDAGRGMGIAGMILGIIGMVLAVVYIFVIAGILVANGYIS